MEYVVFGGQCLIGAVFAVSALSKIRARTARDEFVRVTATLLAALLGRAAGARTARRVAAIVVAAEAAVPVSIAARALHPSAAVAGAAVAVVLLGGFSAALARALRRGVRPPCRCFGASPAPLGARHLARNLVLLAVATAAGPAGLVSGAARPEQAQPAGLALAGGAGLVLAVLVARLDDLVELFVSPAVAGAGDTPRGERHVVPGRRDDPGGRVVPARSAADAGGDQTAAGTRRSPAEPAPPR
ncbi:MauE/DoxX family redox-associated membrane protein [Nonomuraea candida]|uniref:MauE/DoxX family redox-associated membrane protein n=1 Tax=Nonomuraea candida TaxID=359159 RepID=UPI0006932C22|nr:MauE/DoxX family redox-associated membrane protein [Nonomuraea candida]